MKMNFHLNDIAFNLNWVEFNSNLNKIQLKRNGMQIGEESIEDAHEHGIGKNNLKLHKSKKKPFHCFFKIWNYLACVIGPSVNTLKA